MTNDQNNFMREIYEVQIDRLSDEEIDQMYQMQKEIEEAEQDLEAVEWRGHQRPTRE